MSAETDFRALLAGTPAIANPVTTGSVIRIYPATYAQATAAPAIRYSKITGNTGLHMQGSDGLSTATMQVDVRSTTGAAEAQNIRDAIVAKLHGFKGSMGGTDFRLIELQSDRGIGFDDTGPKQYYTASLDFGVWYVAA